MRMRMCRLSRSARGHHLDRSCEYIARKASPSVGYGASDFGDVQRAVHAILAIILNWY